MKQITVLSLFDGISSGRVALERAGIPVSKYYASVPNVSKTQRYEALGNGWTVDVIAHIPNTLVVDFK